MFDVLLFFGFATLIIRFSKTMDNLGKSIDQTNAFVEKAQRKLQEL